MSVFLLLRFYKPTLIFKLVITYGILVNSKMAKYYLYLLKIILKMGGKK